MIKNTICYVSFLALFGTFFSYAQKQTYVDSLQQVLSKQKGIEKIKTLDELSWTLRKTKDSVGIHYALEALQLSEKLNYYSGISDAYNRLGGIAKYQGYLEQAKKHYNNALVIDTKQNYIYGIARDHNQLGRVFKTQKNRTGSLEHYLLSLIFFEKINKHKQAAKVALNLGDLYLSYNSQKESLKYFLKALDFSIKNGDSLSIAYAYKRLGKTQKELKNYAEALTSFKKAIVIYKLKKNKKKVANLKIDIATIYDYLNENELAKKTFNDAENLILKNNVGHKGILYNNIATLYRKLQKKDSAFYFYQKAIIEFKKNKKNNYTLVAYNNIGNLHSDNNDYKNALISLKKSLTIQHKLKDSSMLSLTYASIANVYKDLKNYSLAYQYKDSSFLVTQKDFSKIKAADRYEIAYVNEKKKAATALNKQKIAESKTAKKNILIISLILIILLLSVLFFFVNKARKEKQQKLIIAHEKTKQEQQIQTLISSQEMQAFDAMVTGEEKERKRIAEDLHDNFSSKLALIKILYQSVGNNLINNADENYIKANSLLDEACRDIREISHKMLSGTLANFGLIPALKELKQNIESVYSKQHEKQILINLIFHKLDIRLDNNIEIQIYRILQELLTNIIKHANATQVDIQLLKFTNTVNIIVEDNGIGFNPIEKHKGIGLKNIHSRIVNKLKGNYQIDSGKGNGTTITIDIPIEKTNIYEK